MTVDVIVYSNIEQRVEQLLCNDREMGRYTRAVSGQRLDEHVPSATDTNAFNRGRVFSMWSAPTYYKHGINLEFSSIPCGGGVEYLHRSPASRRRRRKGKSRIWDSKVWSRVPRDLDSRMTALARASSNCKRQTRPLVRESGSHQQIRSCLTIIKIWS
jgi:hypothetical protein